VVQASRLPTFVNVPPANVRPEFGRLLGVARIELGNYDDLAPMEDLAKAFNRDPKRFKRVINQLVRKGYVTVGEDLLETVYPTASALRQQTRDMSEAGAQEILKKLGALKSNKRRR
jgi:DNA-binding MarR family transcriptional regulator